MKLKFALAGLGVGVALLVWLAGRPQTTECRPPAARGSGGRTIEAARIVVRPWLGPHHVYGIFPVPNQFNDRRYSVTLAVSGFETEVIRDRIPEAGYRDRALQQPGHYLKRVYVPTRVAARFLLTGRFGDLRAACHWSLIFTQN